MGREVGCNGKQLFKFTKTVECITKPSALSSIISVTTFRKLPEKTSCPKLIKKHFGYLHGLRIPKMYSWSHLAHSPPSLILLMKILNLYLKFLAELSKVVNNTLVFVIYYKPISFFNYLK